MADNLKDNLEFALETANKSLNDTLIELEQTKKELSIAKEEILKLQKTSVVYRDALLALAKEVN